jgi:hypothetical protein
MRRLALMLCALVLGCGGWSPFWPNARTPADRAREIAPRCTGQSEEQAAEAISPSLVEAVEPAYSTVLSGGGVDRAVHLRGARLHLRPVLNVSAESLQRTLECHQARVTLGSAAELKDDPYVLRGTWLDTRVDSSGDGFVAAVFADKFEDAARVLARARSFVPTRQ